MARAELAQPNEPEVVVTLTKREAAILVALSGYVVHNQGIQRELYDLLKEVGRPYGMYDYLDGESFLGAHVSGAPRVEFDEVNA